MLRIIIVNESKKEKKKFLFIIRLLVMLIIINTMIRSLLSWFNLTPKVSKIFKVSLGLKYNGAKTTIEPFKNKNKFNNWVSLFFSKMASSLPKWYAATIKKIVKATNGKINHKIIIAVEIKMYPK